MLFDKIAIYNYFIELAETLLFKWICIIKMILLLEKEIYADN